MPSIQRLLGLATVAVSLLSGCPPAAVCGNGKVEEKEACDDGNRVSGDGCESTCRLTDRSCGNGKLDEGEACDDGNSLPGDGCEPDCTVTGATCGNGALEGSEACDDGNLVPGDGCEPDCTRSPFCGNGTKEGAEECDDGNQVSGDGCEPGCHLTQGAAVCGNGVKEGQEGCDDGNQTPGDGCESDCTSTGGNVEVCPGASLPEPVGAACSVTTGDGSRLFTAILLTPGKVLKGGQLYVDTAGAIQCVACDCTGTPGAQSATQVVCPGTVVSPGLINSHDHITFQAPPYVPPDDERYEHRHDWRKGNDGHTSISSPGGASAAAIRWAELRQVMAGTTSIAGSGGQNGLLRNLDKPSTSASGGNQEGLAEGASGVKYETFPLGDSAGTEITVGCGYPSIDQPSVIPQDAAYLPHVSEGIEASARNEFLCASGIDPAGQPLMTSKTAVIHGIGVKASEIAKMSETGTSLIWSPRSNVCLYGDTAQVTTYFRMGVNIALGTDWVRSGSMNVLRELRCADSLNAQNYNRFFTDDSLWRMATANAAEAMKTSEKIGRLAAGKTADLAFFKSHAGATYRAVLDANPEDVVLTMRGGKVLYGDAPLVTALSSEVCDPLDVCGTQKAVCLKSETGDTFTSLKAANTSSYELFFCGQPPADEPTCTPSRHSAWTVNNSTAYAGTADSNDSDGDGVPNATDNCPNIFNPVRPLDNGVQADTDGDGAGDVCDVCPVTANSTACKMPSPDDLDADGVPNASDNCPMDANAGQTDTDQDNIGDACDKCPLANPGGAPCPVSIYSVKTPGAGGLFPFLGTRVSLGNVLVTAVSTNGFFIQVHEQDTTYAGPDYSGLFVYKPSSGLDAGVRVNIPDGTPTNFFGQIQLTQVGTLTALPGTYGLPTPFSTSAAEVSDTGARAAQLEGVLVKLSNVTVTNLNPLAGPGDTAPTNEFEVDSLLRVNDFFFKVTPTPSLGEKFTSLTGVLQYKNGHFKVEPRNASDVVAGPPLVVGFGPADNYARAGSTGPTFPEVLTVTLSRQQLVDQFVSVTSSSLGLSVPDGGVLVPAGQVSAPVVLTGVSPTPSVTLTAALGASNLTTTVRVLGASEPATLVAIDPASAGARAGANVTFQVRFDVPPAVDTSVALSVNPPTGFGTLPASVVVAANTLVTSFVLALDPGASGTGTITAQAGGAPVNATLAIQVGADHLVISELATQGTAGSGDEFVELYNPTGSAIDLSGWKLQYKSATGASFSNIVTLPANSSVAPRGYFLVGSGSATGYSGPTALDVTLTGTMNLGAAAGHVRVGPGAMGSTPADVNAVDTVGYGPTANAAEGGAPAPVHSQAGSIERKANSASTPQSMEGGTDALGGNGWDTNQNALDFVPRNLRNPQNKASPLEP